MKDEIKIRSTVNRELSTSVVISGKKYLILTEDLIPQKQLVNTRVYLDGKIISSSNLDCKNALNSPEPCKKIIELIQGQHQIIVKMLKKEQEKRFRTPSKYLWEMKKIGARRKPPIPYLKRTNPINKYIGILLHKLKGD